MGTRSRRRTKNIPLEQALAAIVQELQKIHQVTAAMVNVTGTDKVQAELDRLASLGAPAVKIDPAP